MYGHAYGHAYEHAYGNAYEHAYAHMRMDMYVHMRMDMHIWTCICGHAYMDMCTTGMHMDMCAARLGTKACDENPPKKKWRMQVFVKMHTGKTMVHHNEILCQPAQLKKGDGTWLGVHHYPGGKCDSLGVECPGCLPILRGTGIPFYLKSLER